MSNNGNKAEYEATNAVGGSFDANRGEQEISGNWSFCYTENSGHVTLKMSTGEQRLGDNRRELEAELDCEAIEQLTAWLLQVKQRMQHTQSAR